MRPNLLTRDQAINEQSELAKKISDLYGFTLTTEFDELPEEDKMHLEVQLRIMCGYDHVLRQRIATRRDAMRSNLLTRDQAINDVGLEAVEAVEAECCEPTCAVGYNGICQGDALTEWSAAHHLTDDDGINVTIRAYYYTDSDDEALSEETGTWIGDIVDWTVAGYEIV